MIVLDEKKQVASPQGQAQGQPVQPRLGQPRPSQPGMGQMPVAAQGPPAGLPMNAAAPRAAPHQQPQQQPRQQVNPVTAQLQSEAAKLNELRGIIMQARQRLAQVQIAQGKEPDVEVDVRYGDAVKNGGK